VILPFGGLAYLSYCSAVVASTLPLATRGCWHPCHSGHLNE